MTPKNRKAIKAEIRAVVADLTAAMQASVGQARQVLRKMVSQPLRCAPFELADGRRGYRFVVAKSLDRVIPRKLLPSTYVVTPAGFEPAISTLKGSRPWPG